MLTQLRLIELQNVLRDGVPVLLFAAECAELVDELVEQRADRVKLQGEIERLTHELSKATASRVERAESLARDLRALDAINLPTILGAQPGSLPGAADLSALAQRIGLLERGFEKSSEALDTRIDIVVDIVGRANEARTEEIAKLQAQLNSVIDLLGENGRASGALHYATRIAQLADAVREISGGAWKGWKGVELPFGVQPNPPGFPTGAATTVADALAQETAEAEIEPLRPQRGDRVRLEGARSIGNTKLEDGWYDVTGGTKLDFQIETGFGLTSARYWVEHSSPGLKEVRPGAAKLPE